MNTEKGLAEIKTEEEAKEVLITWIREQGYKDQIVFWEINKKPDGWSFGLFNPHGAFIVYTSGKVEDNQNYFSSTV